MPTTPRRCRCKAKSCWTAASDRRRLHRSAGPTNRRRTRGAASCCATRCWTACARSSPPIAGDAAEIERLLDDSSQRAAFLRAMAAGLRQAKESGAAFDYYQKLIDLEPDQRPLDQIDKTRAVRRDRWIRSQLADLRREAKDDTAAKIDQVVAARFQSARGGDVDRAVAAIRRQLRRPAGGREGARANWCGVSTPRGDVWKRNWRRRRLPTARSRKAVASRPVVWPVGKVEVDDGTDERHIANALRSKHLESARRSGAVTSAICRFSSTPTVDRSSPTTACGRELWKVPLADGQQQQYYSYNPSLTHGYADGHLLLMSLGWKIIAIDTLGLAPNGTPRVLWTQDLMGQTLDLNDESVAAAVRADELAVAAAVSRSFTTSRSFWGRCGTTTPVSSDFAVLWRWIRGTARRFGFVRTCRRTATCSATTSTCSCFRPTATKPACCERRTANWWARAECRESAASKLLPSGEQKDGVRPYRRDVPGHAGTKRAVVVAGGKPAGVDAGRSAGRPRPVARAKVRRQRPGLRRRTTRWWA